MKKNISAQKWVPILQNVDSEKPNVRWLDQIANMADVSLGLCSDPTTEKKLKHALKCVKMTKDVIRCAKETGEGHFVDGAVMMGMAALQAMWEATMLEAVPMMRGGVKQFRGAEAENARRKAAASDTKGKLQNEATKMWRRNPGLSPTDVAIRLIEAGLAKGKPDYVRKLIKKPKAP